MKLNKNNNDKNSLYKNIYGEEVSVLELTLKDFTYKNDKLYIYNDYFIEKKGLIIFYAPWCKHCKTISDLFISLALSNINLFNFGAVNSENLDDKNDILCNYANIKKLPTIKYINQDGELINYPFKYDPDNLIYYINSNI